VRSGCASRSTSPTSWRERAALVREHGLEPLVDTLLERWFTPDFPDLRPYREMFLATDPEGYARCCSALALWDVRDAVDAIRAPTLVVSGADDPAAPPEAGALLAEQIPNARHVVIPDARHLASVERAGEINALLAEHLP
jgi:3-oxoadipate enol-lactonase